LLNWGQKNGDGSRRNGRRRQARGGVETMYLLNEEKTSVEDGYKC
jgi:hypothetical protein